MRFASIRAMDIDLHADLLRAVKQGEGTAALFTSADAYNVRVFTQYTIRHLLRCPEGCEALLFLALFRFLVSP